MNKEKYVGRRFIGDDWGDIFKEIRKAMLEEAPEVDCRIGTTKELLNPVIVLTNPRKRLFYSNYRKFNLVYAYLEAYMLFNDSNLVEPFAYFNSKMREYSDDGITINSAYGQYLAKYVDEIINKLKENKNTRQACLKIYDTQYGVSDTKDVPCTLDLHFLVRDNKLNLTTYMRSNDLFWGLQYDLFTFTAFQEIIANSLGMEVGIYTHCPTSLHVYDYHFDILEKMTDDTIELIEETRFVEKAQNAVAISEVILSYCNGMLTAEELKQTAEINDITDGMKFLIKEILHKNKINNNIKIKDNLKMFVRRFERKNENV